VILKVVFNNISSFAFSLKPDSITSLGSSDAERIGCKVSIILSLGVILAFKLWCSIPINTTRPLEKPFIDCTRRIILLDRIISPSKPLVNSLNIVIIEEP
jgi:hypothetical protein